MASYAKLYAANAASVHAHQPGNSRQGVIVTRTPLRISFAGGGTDLAEFYEQQYGAVLSCAINKYVYVTVKRHSELFYEPIRVNYSKTEQVQSIDELENNIARECLRFLQIEPPIYISTVSDVPASSGLGGSSSFAVGLLHALHAYRGERVSAGQLAEEASYIEIEVLRQPIGKQDQYAAAFGGLNFFRFPPDGAVSVEPQPLPVRGMSDLFDHVMMFWTGMQRDTSSVLADQKQQTLMKSDSLLEMRGHAHALQELVATSAFDASVFGYILDKTWQRKRGLATTITTERIDEWYRRAMQAGAEGGKICGAGGGGFLMLIVKSEHREAVRRSLSELAEISVRHEVYGSQVLVPYMD